jgi:hypothetical protein
MNAIMFEPGQQLDGFSGFFLRKSKIMKALQVQPKLRAGAEKMSQTQRRVARDRPRSVQDLRNPIGWHVHLTRQLRRAHVERFEFFLPSALRDESLSVS